MKNKVAKIHSVIGQNDSYLLEFFFNKEYLIHSIKQKSSSINASRIDQLMCFSPNKVNDLLENSSKVEKKLGWKTKTSFLELVQEMTKYDFNLVKSNN